MTPESFAIWKKTRMDKKEAEQEAMRKAKEQHHSAGKNTGMSGKDLVRCSPSCAPYLFPDWVCRSSNTIPNGSRTRMTETPRTTGTLTSIGGRRRTKTLLRRRGVSPTSPSTRVYKTAEPKVAAEVGIRQVFFEEMYYKRFSFVDIYSKHAQWVLLIHIFYIDV